MDISHLSRKPQQEISKEGTLAMDISPLSGITFNGPVSYKIQVRGVIPMDWSERLEGMSISRLDAGEGVHVSTLEGELADQAALAGVLNTLYELHLPVLSVECIHVS
jgi:hypothetical protein